MSARPLLEADRVSKRFARSRSPVDILRRRHPRPLSALSSVSLSLYAGEALSVVGESGSGKSTLARCLTALHGCDDGRVLFRGQDLSGMSGAERRGFHRRTQLVFQNPFGAMNPRMSIGQAIGEVLRVHGICPPGAVETETLALLDRVRLPPDAIRRRPHEFSGGQLQRAALARALALRPEVIVADEVVSALDVSVQAQIVNLLLSLQRELGLAILFIAHDLHLVRHLSNRVAVMYRGTLVEIGDRGAVFDAPLHPYTQVLIRSAPPLTPGARPASPARAPDRGAPVEQGCVFRPSCPLAEPRCAAEAPPLRVVASGHEVACHAVAASARGGP